MPKLNHHIAKKVPGEAGVWVFIIGDLLMFSLLFGIFLFYRGQAPSVFLDAQTYLRQDLALINTVLLLTSSWFVVRGLSSVRSDSSIKARVYFKWAMVLGIGFVGLKWVEYAEKFSAGVTINTNDFYTYYFIVTIIHLVHLIIGLGVLWFLIGVTKKPEISEENIRTIECGGLYWHMVDLLWVAIVAIIYLM